MNIRPGVYNITLIQGEIFDVTLNLQKHLTKDISPIYGKAFLQVKEHGHHRPVIELATDNRIKQMGDSNFGVILSHTLASYKVQCRIPTLSPQKSNIQYFRK